MFSRLIIIGVGLLGGSIGLAARKYGLAQTVIGVGRTARTLEIAYCRGIVDETYTNFDAIEPSTEAETTLVIVCTPVAEIARYVDRITYRFGKSKNLLITDVGSTKEKLVQKITDPRFIGSHPIAGSERSGPDAAAADLFEGRLTVLTPCKYRMADKIALLRQFWESMGSHVVEMDAAKHDEILAMTSHLPHVLSVALARTISDGERPFTGTGFAGMTRLAAGAPELWRDILSDNGDNVLLALQRFEAELRKLTDALQSKDAKKIEQLLLAPSIIAGERTAGIPVR